jgi:hypothetical protein
MDFEAVQAKRGLISEERNRIPGPNDFQIRRI